MVMTVDLYLKSENHREMERKTGNQVIIQGQMT